MIDKKLNDVPKDVIWNCGYNSGKDELVYKGFIFGFVTCLILVLIIYFMKGM